MPCSMKRVDTVAKVQHWWISFRFVPVLFQSLEFQYFECVSSEDSEFPIRRHTVPRCCCALTNISSPCCHRHSALPLFAETLSQRSMLFAGQWLDQRNPQHQRCVFIIVNREIDICVSCYIFSSHFLCPFTLFYFLLF